jgi:hypothetical protein
MFLDLANRIMVKSRRKQVLKMVEKTFVTKTSGNFSVLLSVRFQNGRLLEIVNQAKCIFLELEGCFVLKQDKK